MGIEGTYLNIIKAIYYKSTADIILNGESISSQIRNKKRVPILTTIIQHSFGSPSHSNQRRKRNKSNPDRKSKTLTPSDDIGNPKDAIRKLLELISEFSKVAGYKVNT